MNELVPRKHFERAKVHPVGPSVLALHRTTSNDPADVVRLSEHQIFVEFAQFAKLFRRRKPIRFLVIRGTRRFISNQSTAFDLETAFLKTPTKMNSFKSIVKSALDEPLLRGIARMHVAPPIYTVDDSSRVSFVLSNQRGHVRRMWLEVEIVSKTCTDHAVEARADKLWSLIRVVRLISNGSIIDELTGETLRALHHLRETDTPKCSLMQRVRNVEACRTVSIPLPLARDVDPETTGVDSSSCWRDVWPRQVDVFWAPHPDLSILDPKLRFECVDPVSETPRGTEPLEFPVEQWQSANWALDRVGGRTNLRLLADETFKFAAPLLFNHRLRQLIWSVTVNGVAKRIRRARMLVYGVDETKKPDVLFDLDESCLLQQMGEQGYYPKYPVYSYDYGRWGPNMSRLADVRLEVEVAEKLDPKEDSAFCHVHARSENALVVLGAVEIIKMK